MPFGWHDLALKHPLIEGGEGLPVAGHEIGVHVPGVPGHGQLQSWVSRRFPAANGLRGLALDFATNA